jgi:hypothetical protein
MNQASPELSQEIRKLQKFCDEGGTIHAAQLKQLAEVANVGPEKTLEQKVAADSAVAAAAAQQKAAADRATFAASDRPGMWSPADKPDLQATADRAQHDADVARAAADKV